MQKKLHFKETEKNRLDLAGRKNVANLVRKLRDLFFND